MVAFLGLTVCILAPAAAKFGTATLNRTSRVAKQGFKG